MICVIDVIGWICKDGQMAGKKSPISNSSRPLGGIEQPNWVGPFLLVLAALLLVAVKAEYHLLTVALCLAAGVLGLCLEKKIFNRFSPKVSAIAQSKDPNEPTQVETPSVWWRQPLFWVMLWWASMPSMLALAHAHVRGGSDIIYFAQTVYHVASTGQPWVHIAEHYNHMALHWHPLLYPLGWLYIPMQTLMPAYVFLMGIQALSGGLVVYASFTHANHEKSLLQQCRLPASTDRFIGLMMLTFWGILSAGRFEFHPVTVGGFVGMSGVLLVLKGRLRLGTAMLSFCMLCGEMFLASIPCLLAFVWAHTWRPRAFMAALSAAFLLGLGWLLLYLKVFNGLFLQPGQVLPTLISRYRTLGNSVGELLLSPFARTEAFVEVVFSWQHLQYMGYLSLLFLPPLLIWILTWIMARWSGEARSWPTNHPTNRPTQWQTHRQNALRNQTQTQKGLDDSKQRLQAYAFAAACLPASGSLAKIMLSDYAAYASTQHHYTADLLPALFLGWFAFLSACLGGAKQSMTRQRLLSNPYVYVLAMTLVSMPVSLNGRATYKQWKQRHDVFPTALREKLRTLPKGSLVYTNNMQVASPLSDRYTLTTQLTRHYRGKVMPDYLVMGWPPRHGVSRTSTKHFSQSFEHLPDGRIVSRYRGTDARYDLLQHFEAKLPGGIWIWKATDVVSPARTRDGSFGISRR